ncbi:MAG TPA: hypothetical protein VHD90_02330 [Phototrophicaceae bacterium]|nr:hypothetical protein [Phototrophicaceae bacterium]
MVKKPGSSNQTVAVWEQDPGSGAQPDGGALLNVPAPHLDQTPYPLATKSKAPAIKVYKPGTTEFRYWAGSAAARRGADFWGTIVPKGTTWEGDVGDQLTLKFDEGDDLNAFYDRTGLSFFHGTSAGRTVYSGESPDIVCHELGHAVLDSIRPQFWDAANFEVPAFHESFGDMSALLTALQVPSLRDGVLQETGGVLYRNSRLSRLAEQLGWAIRQQAPDAVDKDCLRNAVNQFVYRDPNTLPDSAPAAELCREAHSFSRVFTSAFFESLGGMLRVLAGSNPATSDQLLQASQDMAKILVAAILQTPVVPAFFSQVAGHMIAVAAGQAGNPYGEAIKSAFVRHGILSVQSAATVSAVTLSAQAIRPQEPTQLPTTRISVAEFGLSVDTILVHVGAQKRFEVAGSAVGGGSAQSLTHDETAKRYVEDLIRRGRLDTGRFGNSKSAVTHPYALKTHALVEENHEVYLRRLRIDCDFD